MIPEVIGWSDERWEMENARLIVKKNQKIRSEKEEKWSKEQHEFAEKCVEIAKKTMPGFGYYKYTVPVSTITKNGTPSNMNMLIWQHFPDSLCLDDQLDYTNVGYAKNNLDNLQQFKDKERHFYKSVYEKIIDFVKELRKNDDVLVYLNYNINGWSADALNYHYNSIIIGLGPINLVTSPTNLPVGNDSKHWENQLKRKIVIIDMMTDNEWLKWNCTHVFENLREKQPLVAYISLLKCYDKQEMVEIIKQANAEAEKRAAEERAKEEERKRLEAEEARRKAEEQAAKKKREEQRARLKVHAPSVFSDNVKDWEYLYDDFYYTWLFYYYPTTCDFDANEEEWDNRYIVWDFKNDPEKHISPQDHEDTLEEIIPQIKQKLSDTFGEEYLQFLTLVCLPASTAAKNKARFEEFSQRLCDVTGMENAYNYIHIVKDGMSKKDPRNMTGRSIQPEVSFEDWFSDKYVLLFDDVITKGGTMLRYKSLMEKMGATVVGGLSLGKTKHERM
jgi:predicted amidophosphoribosyltransferase